MNDKHFTYLSAIAEERNFSRAARKLNISQPSLSQTVQKIEDELGCLIFDRSASPMKVTEAGEVVIQSGVKICDTLTQMKKALIDLDEEESGTLVIGASPFRSDCIMPGVIKVFRKKFPDVQIILQEEIASELQETAKEGTLDLAITTLPIDEHIFEYQEMMPEEIVLAIPKENPINKYLKESSKLLKDVNRIFPVIDLTDLKDLDYIVLGENQSIYKFFSDLCEEAGFMPKKSVTCRNIGTAYSMVEAGVGATVVPYSLIKYAGFNRRKVCYYSIKQAEYRREMVVIYRKGQYLSDAAKEMLKILTQYN